MIPSDSIFKSKNEIKATKRIPGYLHRMYALELTMQQTKIAFLFGIGIIPNKETRHEQDQAAIVA